MKLSKKQLTFEKVFELYNYKTGFNTSMLSLGSAFDGVDKEYLKVSKYTGTRNKFGSKDTEDFKWFVKMDNGKYVECLTPYKNVR